MRKINPELWLLLFLVLIAAILNFLVASQRMALVFYFLPTLFSAYHLGLMLRNSDCVCQCGPGRCDGVPQSCIVHPPG